MINVSNDYKQAMQSHRNFKSYAEVTFTDGTELTLDSSQFTISNNSLTDGAGISSFPLGTAVQKNVQFEILNNNEQYKNYDFFGAKVRLYIDFKTSESSTERIEKGIYTVITPETYGETVIVTAYNDMYKADKEYRTGLIFPQTTGAVLRDLCDTCGISLGSSVFLHDDFIIQNKPSGTFRDVIGDIAMIACGNARIDTKNRLQIMTYDFSGWETEGKYHLLNEFVSPKIEYNDTVITGFKTVIKGETSEDDTEIIEGTDTYAVSIENPLIIGHEQTVLSWLYESIGNVPFRVFLGDIISNPLIEFMDLAKVQDRRGNQYNTFITDVNFMIPGYTTIANSTPSMLRSALNYSSSASKAEQRTRQLVEEERTARKLAVQRLSESLENASGMYSTDEVQPDNSIIHYLHDKPTLEESVNIIKITSEAIGFSNDGGDSYPYGITLDGQTITRLLYAEGIDADYITTGAITIKDGNGEIVFSVNMDTKQVIISGDSVRIGDKTIEEKISEATPLSIVLTNEYASVSTDHNGNYSGTLSVQTGVKVYYGQTDVTSKCTYTTQKSSSVSGSWSDSTYTYTVTSLTADTGWVNITANYMNLFSVTKRFNVAKVRDGTPGKNGENGTSGRTYFIELSADILKRGANNAIVPSTITANAYYRDGNSAARTSYAGRWIVATSTNGTSFTTVSISAANESSKSYSVSNLSSSIVAVRFTLYAAGGTSNALDIQTVPIVIDVANLTHEQIFNLWTNNGAIKGIYKEGNNLYINASYIKSGEFSAQESAFINPTYEDIDKMLRFISGSATPTAKQKAYYDFDKSGSIDLTDVTLAKQLIQGVITIEEIQSRYGYTPSLNTVTVSVDPSDAEKTILLKVSGTSFDRTVEDGYLGINGLKIKSVSSDIAYITNLDSHADLIIGEQVRDGNNDTEIYGYTVFCNGGSGGLQCNSNWRVTSDSRFKDKVSDLPDEFVEIWKSIEPKTFVWGEKSDIYDPTNPKRQFGIMAQDVISAFEKFGYDINDYGIISDYKIKDDEEKYYSLAYDHYFILTANALKSAFKRIDVLEKQVSTLQNIINQSKENDK